MEQISNAITELQGEVQRQRDEIAFLRSIILTRAPTKPRPSLPDPEKFNGQAHKFDTWLPSMKAKLQVDGDAIGNTTAQFYYVYLNLDSQVQAMVLPQLSQADETSYDYHTIFDQLARVYDNPNKVQEAEDKLFDHKQGTDSLHAYIAKFERVLYEARGQDWPDVNKISTFRNGLNSTLRNRLQQQLNLPHKYNEFIRVVQQLAGRRSTLPTHEQPPTVKFHPSNNNHHADPMDMNAITIGALGQASPKLPTSILQRARSVSPERRQQYRAEGRCVRCGSGQHWVKDCGYRPYSSGPKQESSTGRVVIAALDDDSEGTPSDSSSWKSRDDQIADRLEWRKHESDRWFVPDPKDPDGWQYNR